MRGQWILSILAMFFFVSGCVASAVTGEPSATPTVLIPPCGDASSLPTETPAPTATPTPTRTPQPTPWREEIPVTQTASPTAGYDYTGFDHLPPQVQLSDVEREELIALMESTTNLSGWYLGADERYLYPEMTARPVRISPTQLGLYYHNFHPTGGSGIYPNISRELYLWEDDALRLVWEWTNFGGGRGGYAYQNWNNLYIQFEYVTGNSFADIVMERQTRGQTYDPEPEYEDYWVHFPGRLVFSWDGEAYRLSHFYDRGTLTRIHPQELVAIAPYFSRPLAMDGLRNDWQQVEYFSSGFDWSRIPPGLTPELYEASSTRPSIGWDEQNLYITIWAFENMAIQIGLDTNLAGDFYSHETTLDDFVFEFQFPASDRCSGEMTMQPISPSVQTMDITGIMRGYWPRCSLEIAIPRAEIHLDGELVDAHGVVHRYNDEWDYPLNEYFPASGRLIGFVITATAMEPILNIDITDPTTWGTLIFVSDR